MRHALPVVACLLGLAPLAASSGSLAQEVRTSEPAAPHPVSEYGGVTPGRPNPPPALGRLAARRGRAAPAAILTWPGFQMRPDGGSRFFVQTNAAVATRLASTEGRVEVVFPNTATHVGNSRRYLETAFFETPVVRAHLERRGRDMVLVLAMRASVVPQITSSVEGGFAYTFIDFAPGRYRPADLAPSAPAPSRAQGAASVRPASPESARDFPSSEPADAERPPAVRGPTR